MLAKLLLVAIAVGILAWARKATPASNKSGNRFLGEVSANERMESKDGETLTVASFNIQTGKSDQGRRDILASAKVLQNVDLAGVQEVYAPSLLNLVGLGKPQTQSLADYGGFAWLFSATRRRWLREHRGNAILSKLTVLNWRIEMLPDQSGKSYRNMTIAELEWQGRPFHFINTHLHTRQGKAEQLDVVMREFAKYPTAILVGDFNSKRDMPELNEALKNVDITDAIGVSGASDAAKSDDVGRIDWILTKGFNIESGRALGKGVSDHPYYEVSLNFEL